MWNDLCECISNAQVGRNILDMLRRMTRQHCNDVECPETGNPRPNADGTNPQMIIMTFIMGLQ